MGEAMADSNGLGTLPSVSFEQELFNSPEAINARESDDGFQSENDVTFDKESLPRATPDTIDSSRPASTSPRKKFPSELKTIKCTFEGCIKTFNRQSRLEAHIRSHNNERPFLCQEPGCDKTYVDKKHLDQHTKGSHTNERPHKCNWADCGKSFLTSSRLKRHIEGHEKKVEFKCTEQGCNRIFRKCVTLDRHILSDHQNKAPFPCTFVDQITGLACNAGYDGPTGLSSHMKRQHGPETCFCPECPLPIPGSDGSVMYRGFVADDQLKAHIKKEHNHCSFCGRKCINATELQRHIEGQHSGIPLGERKKIPCTHEGCDKRFTKVYNRNVHVQTQHEGSRFICGTFEIISVSDLPFDMDDGCGKVYASKANLEDHIRTGHFRLPSLINANRKRPQRHESDQDGEFEVDDPISQTKPGRTKKKVKISAIDDLTGHAYGFDTRRKIACLIPSCPHRSMRDYDMKQHLRSKHDLSEASIEELEREADELDEEPEFQFPAGDARNDEAYGGEGGEEDMELEMDRHATYGQQHNVEQYPTMSFPSMDLQQIAIHPMNSNQETLQPPYDPPSLPEIGWDALAAIQQALTGPGGEYEGYT